MAGGIEWLDTQAKVLWPSPPLLLGGNANSQQAQLGILIFCKQAQLNSRRWGLFGLKESHVQQKLTSTMVKYYYGCFCEGV